MVVVIVAVVGGVVEVIWRGGRGGPGGAPWLSSSWSGVVARHGRRDSGRRGVL
jgi:hypothetical protein